MPKFRFKWQNLPEQLLRQLCLDLELDRTDPAESLRAAYGARPSEEFVREAWASLRDRWLAKDGGARRYVVEELWESGLGLGDFPKGREAEIEFLRSRNNAGGLRKTVWAMLIARGEAETERAAAARSVEESQPATRSATYDAARVVKTRVVAAGTKITLSELERSLWSAANALRGPVDPADFKTYVFPMLFWKWISDTWEYEHTNAVDQWGDALDDEIEADFHQFDLPDGTRWSQVTNSATTLGAKITKAFGRIEQANPKQLNGIFGDAVWANEDRLPQSALLNLIKAFNEITLNPHTVGHDMLGQGYEYLLKNFADESGKKAGEFFTPRAVTHLLAGILDPQAGESVYDPACGSGGMLIETINWVRQNGGDPRTLSLYGQEVNLTTSSIAKMNLFLHDIKRFDIARGDTLRDPKLRNPDGSLRNFEVVIANPPFSLQNWGADRWPADPRAFCGVPPAKNGDFAFIQHMITSMKGSAGRVGVVMPHGVLFRGGVEGKIRQCLLEEDRLEAVIGLPSNLFYSTTIPACLLIFRAEKNEERRNHVLFIDASARFAKGVNQNTMTEADVEDVFAAYRIGGDPDGEGGIAIRLVPLDEIKTNEFDLNIGRYVKAAVDATTDLPTAMAEYQAARAARLTAEEHMFTVLGAAGIEVGDD